jgi:hypothetical protein
MLPPLQGEISDLNLQKSWIIYLDKYGFLEEMLTSGAKYLEKIKAVRERGAVGLPFCFKPLVDLVLITNISGMMKLKKNNNE